MSFIPELCRDKEPEVPRNVNNNSITEPDRMFPFLFLSFLCFYFLFLREKQKQRKFD